MGTRPYTIDPQVAHERGIKAARTRTKPGYHLDKIREHVARTRAEQGLPPTVEDDLTLGKIAELFKLDPGTPDNNREAA